MARFTPAYIPLLLSLLHPQDARENPAGTQTQLPTKRQLPLIQTCDQLRSSAEFSADHNFLIYSSRTEIGSFDLTTNAPAPPITNLRNVVGVFLDATSVYWTSNDPQNEAINRAPRSGTGVEVIAIAGIEDPEGLAVDWITGNIYFTDEVQKRIGVCTNCGSHCASILTENLEKPRGLVLHPSTGQMYWSDWGNHPHISRAEMNGKSRVPVVTDNIVWPNGLAIDHIYSRLYWADAKLGTIESINFVGTDRKIVLGATSIHPFSLAVFGDRLFWSDWQTKSIESCNKTNGENRTTFLQGDHTINGIYVYQPVARINFDNPCESKPCEEICLLGADLSYTCACSGDKTLRNDEKTCESTGKEDRLIFAARPGLLDYHHEKLGRPRWKSIDNFHQFDEVFHPSSRSLSSDGRYTIFNEATRLLRDNQTFVAIAYDYVGNNLYTADAQHNRIRVLSLSTMKMTFLRFSEEPRSILLVPKESTMLVTFCLDARCHIDKLSMAGSERRRFLRDTFAGPRVPLGFDEETKRVFWADEETGRLESISFTGHDRKELELGLRGPVSLAIVGDHVFGVLNNSREIFWASKTEPFRGKKEFNLTGPIDGNVLMMNVNYPGENSSAEPHECQVDHGGCSHVCLLESPGSHVCRCPPEMILDEDQKTCKSP